MRIPRANKRIIAASCMLLAVALYGCGSMPHQGGQFPVTPILLADSPFTSCEGIAFNGEGRMFTTCSRAFWEIRPDGSATRLGELDSNLGVAAIGERDLLVADFGPTSAFRQQRNFDGVVWRFTPEGKRSIASDGFGDPNFIVVMPDGSYLVSDDATSDIYRVDEDRNVTIYTTAVNHPNGLVLSNDGQTLYVAQIFLSIRPVIRDNTVWAIDLDQHAPVSAARLVARTGPEAANDGLAMDSLGRLYIAANNEGRIWRYDPASDTLQVIAENMYGVASLAFGAGAFDRHSIYAVTTFSQGRGGQVWQVPVGVTGQNLYR